MGNGKRNAHRSGMGVIEAASQQQAPRLAWRALLGSQSCLTFILPGALASLVSVGTASAQDQEAAVDDRAVETITVTARKREETVLEVPESDETPMAQPPFT